MKREQMRGQSREYNPESNQERTIKKEQKRGKSREDNQERTKERTIKRGQSREDCPLFFPLLIVLSFVLS
jgi:hypothetical protein